MSTGVPTRDERIAALFATDYVRLCRLAALLLRDRGQAEEVVMDSFAQVLTSWRRIRDLDAAPAYLQRAVLNRCHGVLRRRGPEQRATQSLGQQTDHLVRPLEPVDHVARAVRALPPRQREAIVLTFWLGLSEAETAAAMGCRPGTVKATLSHARTTLARALEDDRG